MINYATECRPMEAFKDFDWKNATIDDIVEFCLVPVGEAGMAVPELIAMWKTLETFNGRPLVIVETGLGWGFSTRMFIAYIMKYGGEFYSIDIQARDNIKKPLEMLGLWDKVNMMLCDSRRVNWPEDKMIDFLNIDSEHALSFALGEYMRFRMFLTDYQSVVAFHDVDCCYGVSRALDIVNEIDVLEVIQDATKNACAGWRSFKMIRHDRNDEKWNTGERR
jgi:hypothetical protein